MNAKQRHAAVHACMMEVIADMDTTSAELRADKEFEQERQWQREHKASQAPELTAEQREERRQYHREYARKRREKAKASMTPSQKEEQLAKNREYSRRWRESKSTVQREAGINYKQGEKGYELPEHLRTKKYQDYNAEELAEYKRILRSRRNDKGLCSCGQRPPKEGRKMCHECVTAARLRTKARRARLKAERGEI